MSDLRTEAKLLRAAVEASIEVSQLDLNGDAGAAYARHAEATAKADAAWKELDRYIWIDRIAE